MQAPVAETARKRAGVSMLLAMDDMGCSETVDGSGRQGRAQESGTDKKRLDMPRKICEVICDVQERVPTSSPNLWLSNEETPQIEEEEACIEDSSIASSERLVQRIRLSWLLKAARACAWCAGPAWGAPGTGMRR
jgi:hypothetical protein